MQIGGADMLHITMQHSNLILREDFLNEQDIYDFRPGIFGYLKVAESDDKAKGCLQPPAFEQ